ncbi:reverse transcriptase domain-containing protein [Tanacetum coccineum]
MVLLLPQTRPPILAEKMHQEKVQQEKLKAVKARLNFEETSQYSESGAPSRRRDVRKRLGPKDARSVSRSLEPRRDRSRSPRRKDPERETVFRRLEKAAETPKAIIRVPARKERSSLLRGIRIEKHTHVRDEGCQKAKTVQEDIGNLNPKSKESIDSYDDLKEAFLANYLQQKKCIKDPVEIHHIKQREGESMEDFVWRFKIESRDVKGAPEVMRISRFMYGITNHELIKRLHDKIRKSVDEMWKITTAFLRGEVAAGNQERKKTFPSWKQQDAGHRQSFKKGGFKNQQRPEKRQDRFALLTKTPKEILALDKGKFKHPPPMTTPVEKRNASKFCEFHGEVRHTTDECMHLKRQIEEMLKAGKLSHLIKDLKQNNGKDQAKGAKKGEATGKDKPQAILMVQAGRKIAKQRITQTFSPETMISFPPLGEEDGTEGPMVIEAEVGGHLVYRMYVDGGASLEILYEHCFNQLRLEFRNQMVPATTYLVRFSGEIIWPLGSHSSYNGIIGRPDVRRIKEIPSTAHGMLKFPVIGRTVTLRSSRIIPLECAMISEPRMRQPVVDQGTEEKIQVAIHPEYPE